LGCLVEAPEESPPAVPPRSQFLLFFLCCTTLFQEAPVRTACHRRDGAASVSLF